MSQSAYPEGIGLSASLRIVKKWSIQLKGGELWRYTIGELDKVIQDIEEEYVKQKNKRKSKNTVGDLF